LLSFIIIVYSLFISCLPNTVNKDVCIGQYSIYLFWRDGKAVRHIPRWLTCPQAVTYPSTNPARHRLTSLIGHSALPLRNATQ